MRSVALSVLSLFLWLAAPALAQNAPPPAGPPITGVIQSIDGKTMTVKAGDGRTVSLNLPAELIVTKNSKATFASIKPGDFVASAAVQQADGKIHAQEVRIFPEAMRGRGEGHRPMAQPNQTMTNATVAEVVSTSDGGVLKTRYPGGTTDIVVDPQTPITAITTVDRDALKPGAAVSVRADPPEGGAITARTVTLQ